jgi:hypothetical protein
MDLMETADAKRVLHACKDIKIEVYDDFFLMYIWEDSIENIAEHIAVIFDEAFAIGANTEKYIDLAKRIKTDMKDPFYSEANQAILTESIAQLNRTIGRKK